MSAKEAPLNQDFLDVDELLVDTLDDSNELLQGVRNALQTWMNSEELKPEWYLSTSVFSMTCADPKGASVLPVSSLRDGFIRQSIGSGIASDLSLLRFSDVFVNLPAQVSDDLFAAVARGTARIKDSSVTLRFIRNMTVQVELGGNPENETIVIQNMFIISDQLHVLSFQGA